MMTIALLFLLVLLLDCFVGEYFVFVLCCIDIVCVGYYAVTLVRFQYMLPDDSPEAPKHVAAV
jgi:hypothetical protein